MPLFLQQQRIDRTIDRTLGRVRAQRGRALQRRADRARPPRCQRGGRRGGAEPEALSERRRPMGMFACARC